MEIDEDEDDFALPQKQSNNLRLIVPWTEKYRPVNVHEVCHQDEVVKAMSSCIQQKNIPHLLFYGPPGTGKTSVALAVARQLFGINLMKERVLELNASDERGIDVVRERVKKFAQFKVSSSGGGGPPPFKIIILDEADSMTRDAQAALRRTMEIYSKVTRFCIICNYVSRIIEPITSRCAKFRFQPISRETQISRLRYIAEKEGMNGETESALEALVDSSEGDLRRAISLLQSSAVVSKTLTKEAIEGISGKIPEIFIKRAKLAIEEEKTIIGLLQNIGDEVCNQGFAVIQFLSQLLDLFVASETINDFQKANIAKVVSLVDERLNNGADERLQLIFSLSLMREVCQGRQAKLNALLGG